MKLEWDGEAEGIVQDQESEDGKKAEAEEEGAELEDSKELEDGRKVEDGKKLEDEEEEGCRGQAEEDKIQGERAEGRMDRRQVGKDGKERPQPSEVNQSRWKEGCEEEWNKTEGSFRLAEGQRARVFATELKQQDFFPSWE